MFVSRFLAKTITVIVVAEVSSYLFTGKGFFRNLNATIKRSKEANNK